MSVSGNKYLKLASCNYFVRTTMKREIFNLYCVHPNILPNVLCKNYSY